MTYRLTVIVLLLASLAVHGCGVGGSRLTNGRAGSIGEDIDPFAFGDEFARETDSIEYSPTAEPINKPPSETAAHQSAEPIRPSAGANVYGYRVQIGLFEDREQMERTAEQARSVQDLPVYVEYEAPFYRVRIGDFTTRESAEDYVRFMKEKGFVDALWVMSKIQLQ